MPRMLDSVSAGRELNLLKIGESFCVIHCDALSSFPELIAFPQLFNPDGSRDIGQIVLESRVENLVIPRTFLGIAFPRVMADSVETHYPHSLSPFRVLCRRHPAFASGDRFGRVEGKTGDIADRPYHSTAFAGRQGVSRIFDDSQVVLSGDI